MLSVTRCALGVTAALVTAPVTASISWALPEARIGTQAIGAYGEVRGPKTLKNLRGKRVLIRLDLNVPRNKETGAVTDDARIRAALPTIKYVLEQNAIPVIGSHLGRPKMANDPTANMKIVSQAMQELLPQYRVILAPGVVGQEVKGCIQSAAPGKDVVLLQNLRYHEGEKKNDQGFAKELASLGDFFIGDGFGVMHRTHASTDAVPRLFATSKKSAGFLVLEELDHLTYLLGDVSRPYVGVFGGVKLSGKVDAAKAMIPRVDTMFIGGAMANLFYKASGKPIGRSLAEGDENAARDVMAKADNKLLLPKDFYAASSENDRNRILVPAGKMPADLAAFDIGDKSLAAIEHVFEKAGTIVWNGPLGLFEKKGWDAGTNQVAKLIADATARGARTYVGGGESGAALRKAGYEGQVTWLSSGGGAFLYLLTGAVLPGVQSLIE